MTAGARRALLGVASLLGGCVYLNSLYNARRLFDEAERATWAGRDAEARRLYDSVVAKSARSYRSEPDGGWADDALYLLGRAHLRRGEPERAEAAFRQVLAVSDDERLRTGARLHLGVAAASRGRRGEALELLGGALGTLGDDALEAEGRFWRGRMLLESGSTTAGWADLDAAAETDGRYRVPVGLDRLRWGVVHGDTVRTREGAARLLAIREAHVREDSVRTLVERAARRWGPAAAGDLLAGLEESAWPQDARDRLLLERAGLRLEAGDELAAVADAARVADGVGEEVTDARLLIARVLFRRAREVEDLGPARGNLLPAVGDPRVLELVEAIRMVELLVERGGEEGPPEALFAAAELARDVLGARFLARSLLIRYAEASDEAWSGKALLAALDLTDDPGHRPPLLRRLARMRNNPYVEADPPAPGTPPRILELDAELQDTLTRVLAAAAERARELDVLARERSDTVR